MLIEEQIREDIANLAGDTLVKYILDLQREAHIEGWQNGYEEGYIDGVDYYY